MIPDWKLERYRLGELQPDEQASIAQAIAQDAELRARVAALDESDRAIRSAYPTLPPRRAPARAEPARSPARFWFVPVLVAAGLAALVVFNRPPPTGEDVLTPKGDPALRVFRLAGPNQPERLVDGAHVKPHEVVQVAVDLQGARYLVVVSVDGSGHTTLHWPLDGGTAAPAGFKAVPASFELDDAPGFERFFLVTSSEPLAAQTVLDAAQHAGRSGALSVPGRVAIRSVLLDKESR